MIGYVTLEETKDYLNARFEKIPSDPILSKNLLLAFDKIETIDIRYSGTPNKFPRTIETEIPQNIKQAQILEAYTMSNNPKLSAEIVDNVKSKSIGDYSISYSDNKIQGVSFYNKVAYDTMMRYKRKSY